MSCAAILTGSSNTGGGGSSGNAPIADFSVSDEAPFIGEQLQFLDNSANMPTSWEWTANGDIFASVKNPVFYCNQPGYVTFVLTATNQFGSSQHTLRLFVDSNT